MAVFSPPLGKQIVRGRASGILFPFTKESRLCFPSRRSSKELEEGFRQFDSWHFGAAEAVLVRTGDDVLWPQQHKHPPRFAMMKLDVEGFECNVVRGMRRLLSAGSVQTIKFEVYDVALRAQNCSAVELQRLISENGFHLYRTLDTLKEARCRGSADSLHRNHKPLSPNRLHGGSHTAYNLYAIHCPSGDDLIHDHSLA